MEIVRTDVLRAISPTGEPIVRVHFCGEGGDCVTVDMAYVDTESETVALDRARAVLVQTATFGVAENEYDAQSNGNFDVVAATAAADRTEAIYIFEYRDGERSRRIPPSIMPSFEAARKEALRCSVDLLLDLEPGTDPLIGWLVRVRSEGGELLYEVDVQQAESARQLAA